MKIDKNNYFSYEANMQYASVSQIKDFLECEQCAYMKLKGQYEEEPSKAMAISSLIDAVMSNEETEFLNKEKENPNSFIYLKSGKLSADAQTAYEVIEQAKNDPMFMKYLGGEHQVIMTGVIENVPVKIKMDSYFEDKVIVDLKAIRDLNLIWDEKDRIKKNFIDYYDYILQAAIYQEIVYQNTGKKLPFIIAAMTKEKISERALLNIPQQIMDERLNEIKEYLPRLQAIKQSEIAIVLNSCGKCDYCKSLAKVHNIYNYNEYFEKRGGN